MLNRPWGKMHNAGSLVIVKLHTTGVHGKEIGLGAQHRYRAQHTRLPGQGLLLQQRLGDVLGLGQIVAVAFRPAGRAELGL